jgi:hypothetical protein
MSIRVANDWFDALPASSAKQNGDRRAHPQGNPRAAEVPERCRARLPDPVAHLRHAVGRRKPAHPAGLADRLRPHRRALRAGRALHRPAPARQCPPAGNAQAPARYRQHRHRGGTRRGRHPHRRLRGRHRPRRRCAWRRDCRPGHAGRHHGEPALDHRQVSLRRTRGRGTRQPPETVQEKGTQGRRRPRQQPEERLGLGTARRVHLRHRCLGRRQVHLADRDALQGRRAQADEARARTRRHDRIDGLEHSTRSSTSTSRRSAARRARTRPPTPAPSRRSATGLPACRKPRRAATSRAGSRSTSRAGAARPARATASSRSRCTSCPTST